jgi:large subunit ribosomal protein L29
MKARELRDMDDDLLLETVRNARKELFGLRFRHATGELENTAGLGAAKRDLARALTLAHQRGLSVETELTPSE